MRAPFFPFVCPVRGVSFHQDVVVRARVGDRVVVQADPGNEFDANACAVRLDGELVGHLPRELAARLRAEGHLAWDAEVCEVLYGSKATGLRLRVLGVRCDVPDVVAASKAFDPVEDAIAEGVTIDTGRGSGCSDDRDVFVQIENLEVVARSGRRLGRYRGRRDSSVLVETTDCRQVAYPESLVEVRSPR